MAACQSCLSRLAGPHRGGLLPPEPSAAAPQAWKERVYPLLRQHLADNVDQVVAYLLLYHESAVANLLEVRRRGRVGSACL